MFRALKSGIVIAVVGVLMGCIGLTQSEGPEAFDVVHQVNDVESASVDSPSQFYLDEDALLLRETEPDLGVYRLDYQPMYSDVF